MDYRPHGSRFVSLASPHNDARNDGLCLSEVQLAPSQAGLQSSIQAGGFSLVTVSVSARSETSDGELAR